MAYEMNMNGERKPAGLIPKGHRQVRITEMIESKSKAGNLMFITQVEDIESRVSMAVYLIGEEKKRWMLKSLLTAVGCPAGEDGVYKFETSDVIGHTATAVVDHIEEEYINRAGDTVKALKAKISEFYPAEEKPATAWEEEEPSK